MAWLTIAKASEGHPTYGSGCNGLSRARALSRVTQSEAVVVGGVGTTSMARSRCSSLDGLRAKLRGRLSTRPLRCRGMRDALGPTLLLLIEEVSL